MKTPARTAREAVSSSPATNGVVANPHLRRVVAKLRDMLAKGNVRSAEDHHDIGREVQKVEDQPSKYGLKPGESAVDRLALETGYSDDTIRNDLAVARCWKTREYSQLLQREGKEGARLTRSHLIEVAKLEDATDRDAMVERALAEGMSYRAVARAVGGEAAGPAPDANRLEKIIAVTTKAIKTARRLTASIERIDEQGGTDEVTLAAKAAELQHELIEQCRKSIAMLQAKRDALERASFTPVGEAAAVTMPDAAPAVLVTEPEAASPTPGAEIPAAALPTRDVVAQIPPADAPPADLVANAETLVVDPVVEVPSPVASSRGASENPPTLASVGTPVEAPKKRRKLLIVDVPGVMADSPVS